jgi:hypothetical protein
MLLPWLLAHLFEVIGTCGVVGGLYFNAVSLRANTREQRIKNLFTVTAAHREIWEMALERPELQNIFQDIQAGRSSAPTFAESRFIGFLIHNLAASYRARKNGMFVNEAGLKADIREFFSKPIPHTVWRTAKQFLEPDFVIFVDSTIQNARPKRRELGSTNSAPSFE